MEPVPNGFTHHGAQAHDGFSPEEALRGIFQRGNCNNGSMSCGALLQLGNILFICQEAHRWCLMVD